MRFAFAILLSAIAQTVVSALPIADVQRDLVIRGWCVATTFYYLSYPGPL